MFSGTGEFSNGGFSHKLIFVEARVSARAYSIASGFQPLGRKLKERKAWEG